ncbi:MAG: bifunctional ornithine acetyltransferase/N-acetylglutamate synthase, partial [Mogibacterium sp.]|nr:bifunctional ornithine acetyltransferase/N-acetylglutamate synthase [Mogibacterium sp.]
MEFKNVANVKFVEGGVCAAKGFRANGIQCGLAHAGASVTKKKNDLALIVADTECTAAAVYTTNKVKGAPILVTKEHLKNGKARA